MTADIDPVEIVRRILRDAEHALRQARAELAEAERFLSAHTTREATR